MEKLKDLKIYQFIPVGLLIYSFILITTFIKTQELFSVYIPKEFAFGVALGFDVLVLYYSILSVIYPNIQNKLASFLSGALLWIMMIFSLLKYQEFQSFNIIELLTPKYIIGVIISLFIPMTSILLGKVIGITTKDIKRKLEQEKDKKDNLKDLNEIKEHIENKTFLLKDYGDMGILILPSNYYKTSNGNIKKNIIVPTKEFFNKDNYMIQQEEAKSKVKNPKKQKENNDILSTVQNNNDVNNNIKNIQKDSLNYNIYPEKIIPSPRR